MFTKKKTKINWKNLEHDIGYFCERKNTMILQLKIC